MRQLLVLGILLDLGAPNLLTQYDDRLLKPNLPAPELTFIMIPDFFAIIQGTTAFAKRKAPFKLVLIV
jgi:hypothetical protein